MWNLLVCMDWVAVIHTVAVSTYMFLELHEQLKIEKWGYFFIRYAVAAIVLINLFTYAQNQKIGMCHVHIIPRLFVVFLYGMLLCMLGRYAYAKFNAWNESD